MNDDPGRKQADLSVSEMDRLDRQSSEMCTKDHSIRDRLDSIEDSLNLLIALIPLITVVLLKIVDHFFPGLK